MSYPLRQASHAGPNGCGWYEAVPEKLKQMIDAYFVGIKQDSAQAHSRIGKMIGVIAPHAGLSYSGRTAADVYAVMRAYLYSNENGKKVQRIFILGPSHHKGFEGVEISGAKEYETPFGSLRVDTAAVTQLHKAFRDAKVPVGITTQRTDENEHSLEMQTPFISHILHYPPTTSDVPLVRSVSIVPIIVGDVDNRLEERIGHVLQPYCESCINLFVFSSDFCHWGRRFDYTYHYERGTYPQIGDSIIAMDHAGMDLLEKRDVDGWRRYLKSTCNTICGRHPISVGMQALRSISEAKVTFLGYSQSNKCASMSDSSVSYASAVITA